MRQIIRVALVAVALGAAGSRLGAGTEQGHEAMPAGAPQAAFQNYQDLKWSPMFPDLGASSPEVCILSVDPGTQATKLIVRTPKGIHVRKHWHSANETHTVIFGRQTYACEGKRVEQGPGSFNTMPAKMVHEAWFTPGAVAFITVDGAWDINWVDGPPTAADLSR